MASDNSKDVEGNPNLEIATEEFNLDSASDQVSSTDVKLAAVESAIEQHFAAGQHQRTYEVVGLITVCFGSDNDRIIDSEAMKTCFNSHLEPTAGRVVLKALRKTTKVFARPDNFSLCRPWQVYKFSMVQSFFSQPEVGLDGTDILYALMQPTPQGKDGNTTFTQALIKDLSEWDKNTIPTVANIYMELLRKRKKVIPYWNIISGTESIILPLKGAIAAPQPRNNTADEDKIDLNPHITLAPNLEDPTVQE
ncbi:hypothetical protein BGX38DRAFT_1270479 [Terfezia claveryi]|nr:hypothetical protein BGX38DRAFT_1270479 [Terfezia claveryi]